MKKVNTLFIRETAFVLIALLLFGLSSCDKKTDENTLYGQIYYNMAIHKEIIGICSVKVYKAEGIPINLVTAIPAHVTTSDSKGYYEFKRILSDDAWWLVASVNYVDTIDLIRKRYTCEKIVGIYELSGNTKTEVNIQMDIN
ncbi:MAG: hypothetical protein LBG80_18070 [Bacteroidales bacterium]|jgi:hypothetical protein|nr:hypothetical protein [Bacteroidales bacterium]